MAKDYYDTLGVSRTATDADIKKAFRTLAHEHHPDKGGGSDAKFKEINEAYQVLGNADKRKQYDQFGPAFDGGSSSGFAWQNMGGRNPFGGAEGFGQSFDFGDLGEMFGDVFGFGRTAGERGGRVQRGNDVEARVTISFDDAYNGTEQELTLNLLMACDVCGGTGDDPGAPVATCTTCKGSGVISSTQQSFLGAIRTQIACSRCRGTGKRAERSCHSCHGESLKKSAQTLKFRIPAGIGEGQAIKLSGRGESGLHAGPRGDLYIRAHINSHPVFTRDGQDIRSRAEIPLSVLIGGGTTLVDTPTGSVKLKIPAHTRSGTEFVLRSKGFEKLTARGRGDQYVTVHAKVPGKLTASQKHKLEELEKDIFQGD